MGNEMDISAESSDISTGRINLNALVNMIAYKNHLWNVPRCL
jgi:hypothetical protein